MKIGQLVLLLVFCSGIANTIQAQSSKYPWSVGIHPSMLRFFSLDESQFIDSKKYDFGVQFSFARYLNRSLDVGLESTFAIVQHPAGEGSIDNMQLGRDNFYAIHPFAKYKINNGYILPENLFLGPYLKTGIGINKSALADGAEVYFPLAFGLNFRLGKAAAIELQTSYNFSVKDAEDFIQTSIGFVVSFGTLSKPSYLKNDLISDRDGDGIPDFSDHCPDEAGFKLGAGCPDEDGDGILDENDKCPEHSGYANTNGCPDSDADGLNDSVDECPLVFGSAKLNGCPPADLDKDRIYDSEDACPDKPGLFTTNGCPDQDGDGIRDSEDACPDKYAEPGTDGCPNIRAANVPPVSNYPGYTVFTEENICDFQYVFLGDIGKQVFFETNSSTLNPQSTTYLDQIADIMNNCSDHRLLVTAHTDSDGDAGANLRLSTRRAARVKAYLVNRGVSNNRLIVEAFGETSPLVPNDSPENKQKNRRVEFTLFR